MAQTCEICGRGPQFGNRISHAHNVTKRRWNLNLQSVRALINGAGRRVCTSCIRDGKVKKVA
jgi:large subunit ribosomal protein L28